MSAAQRRWRIPVGLVSIANTKRKREENQVGGDDGFEGLGHFSGWGLWGLRWMLLVAEGGDHQPTKLMRIVLSRGKSQVW
jgi:hypothetical protein